MSKQDEFEAEIDKMKEAVIGGEPMPDHEKILIAELALSHVLIKAHRDCKEHGATTKHTLQSLNVLSHWLWRHEEMQKTRRLNVGEFKFVFSGVPNQPQLETENDAEVKA